MVATMISSIWSGSEFVGRRDVTLFDSGSGGDPFIRRIDQLFQIGVGENFWGDVRAHAGDGTSAALKIVFGARVSEF